MIKIKTVFYYLLLSIVSIILILLMAITKQGPLNTINLFDKLLVAFVFFCSCIFGISIAIYPNWWRKNKRYANHALNLQKAGKKIQFKGHHPDCIMFKNHTIVIKNKPRCAGCLGLILGAFISIILMILYLIIPFSFSISTYYIFLFIGIFILIFVYTGIIIFKRRIFLHIILNSFLVFSFFIITVSVAELSLNPIYGVLTVLLCFLWLDARIHISNLEHQKICASCKQICKSYSNF